MREKLFGSAKLWLVLALLVVFVALPAGAFAQAPTPVPVAVPDFSGTVTGGIDGVVGQLATIMASVIAGGLALWAMFRGYNAVRGGL